MAVKRYMRRNLDRYITLINAYFTERESRGLGVPESCKTPGTYSLTCIATGTGIPTSTLKSSHELQNSISEWIKKIGFSKAENRRFGAGAGTLRYREYQTKIEIYLEVLRQKNKK